MWPASSGFRRALATVAALAGVLVSIGLVRADEFVLKHGGRVRGRWLNPGPPPAEIMAVATDAGGEIRLDRSAVAQVIRSTPLDEEYAALRSTCPDTVAGHWQMVQWCAERQLSGQRQTHLERILELDPDHEAARLALGYRRVDGAWMTRDEEMESRGLKRHGGQYRTAQDIELRERDRKQRDVEREWFKKLKRWRSWLVGSNPGRVEEAQASIRAIRDACAAPALTEHLYKETDSTIRLLLAEALAQVAVPTGTDGSGKRPLASRDALEALVHQSLNDPDQEVRVACLEHLVDMHHPHITELYVRVLKSKDNVEVNQAAAALKALGDATAIPPLIDALVTVHKFQVGSGSPGQTSASFSRDGRGGMGFGQGGPTIVKRPLRNPEVLSALVALSGENFEYSAGDWNSWYAAQRRSRAIDARRD